MKRKVTLVAAVLAVLVLAGAQSIGPASAQRRPLTPAPAAITFQDGIVETDGFNPAGLGGDVAGARATAEGANQTSAVAATAATVCKTYTAYRQGNSAAGTIWRFNHTIYWCYNGTRIVGTPTSWVWASNLAPGWRYDGQISSSTYWRPAYTQYYAWRQGKFRLCAQWCVQEVHPWVSWLVLWEGSATYRTG